jgi:hypothetical protein
VSYRLLARLEVDEGKLERARRGLGRFLLATDVLDREALPAGEVLGRYKDQTRTVERGFRFLKDPLFFTGSTFLKRPERVMALGMVMALALLVYALGEWALRRGLAETGSSLPDQKGRPTQRPTLRWVFQLFIWVRLVELEGRPLVLNLAPHHEMRLLGAQTSWSEGGAECGRLPSNLFCHPGGWGHSLSAITGLTRPPPAPVTEGSNPGSAYLR